MTEFWFPIFIIVALVLSIGFLTKRLDHGGEEGAFGVVFLGLILVVLLIFWPICYVSSVSTIARMEAFVNSNKSVYEHTIVSTQEIEIKAVDSTEPVLNVGKLAYLKLGPEVSERIKELRKKTEWYNEMLKKYERFNEFYITRGFYANIPEGMMPIILE